MVIFKKKVPTGSKKLPIVESVWLNFLEVVRKITKSVFSTKK